MWLWEDIHWGWFIITMLFFACEFVLGAILVSIGSPSEKSRGYRLISQSIEALIRGCVVIFLLGFLWSFMLAGLVGAELSSSLKSVAEGYEEAVTHIQNYLVSLGWIAAQLYMTPLTSPLGHVWMAQSWLATYSAQTLLALLSGYRVITSILADYGMEMLSIGLALTATTRLRGIGGALVSNVIVLSCYMAVAERTIVRGLNTVELNGFVAIPLIGPTAEILKGGAAVVIEHGKIFVSAATTLAFTFSIALLLAAGLSEALGGLARALSARV